MYTVKAIRKDTQQWITGYLWQGSNYAGIIPHNLGVSVDNNRMEAVIYEVDAKTICKPLGVDAYWFDKQGGHIVPLYENDIVQFDIGKRYEGILSRDFDKIVIRPIGSEDAFFDLSDVKDPKGQFVRVKIIGNQFNNTEERL